MLPSVMPSAQLMASKYILRMSGSSQDFLGVAEGGVEDAALAVHLAPGHGEVMIGAMDAGIVVVVELRRRQG